MALFARTYLWGRSKHIRRKRRRRGDVEYELLPLLVKSDCAAIDVGANRGVYTIPMAERAKHVWAYEPNPWIADLLTSGVPKNVTVKNLAVSDVARTVTLRVPKRKDGSLAHNQGSIERYGEEGMASVEVKAVRLDDENLGTIGFIKLDAEDHELPVIQGARNLIRRDRPNLLIEILGFANNSRWEPIRVEMESLGYEAYVLRLGALELAPAAGSAAASGAKRTIGLNVLFLPRN